MSQNLPSPKTLARKKRAAAALKANLKRRKEAGQAEDAPQRPPEAPSTAKD